MATTKKTPVKSVPKNKNTSSARRKKSSNSKKQASVMQNKHGNPVNSEIFSIIFVAMGIFVFFSIYFENITGFLGAPFKNFLMGMFGIGAYILPLAVTTLSVVSLINKNFKLDSTKIAQGAAIFITFLVFMHLLSFEGNTEYQSAISYIGSFYEGGAATNGGLTGAAFGNVLLSIFGKFGAYLIIVIAFVTTGMAFTGKSIVTAASAIYLYVKEKWDEANNYEYEYEYVDEDEEQEVEEPPRRASAKTKPSKDLKPREQLRFELPPVRNARRNPPSNIIIENRRKPEIEESILIFNKDERTLKKPILMPPTRKVVDVMTLKQVDQVAQLEKPIPERQIVLKGADLLDEFEEPQDVSKNEVYVETPLIRHYERRSFVENIPFSDGGRYKYPQNAAQYEDAAEYEDAPEYKETTLEYEEPSASYAEAEEDSAIYEEPKNSDYKFFPDEHDDTDDLATTDEPEISDESDDDESDTDESETDDSHDITIFDDDFGKMMSEAYEQKLREQELNALMLAKTGPHPALGLQPAPPPAPVVEKAQSSPLPITPPPKPVSPLLSATANKKQPDKAAPITVTHEEYSFPPVSLLNMPPQNLGSVSRSQILETSRKLEETLKSFSVEAKVIEVSKGPTVTRYELSPGAGVKVRKISDLGNDLALNLAAESIRIEAPIPGKAAVGIEIPNKEVTPVFLREVIDDDLFRNYPSKLAFALGKDITGNTIVTDIAKMPHLLIAGATGSGKSVCINTLITSLIFKADPNEVKLVMIDPKVVELSIYNGIPHLLIPVVTEPKKAAGALNWAVQEMLARYNAFAETSVRDLKGYNALIRERGEGDILPQIVIIIDELADLMMAAPGEVEDAICRLAQMARAAGLHLIIATQRPSVDVITGVIKANIPSRMAFSVSSGTDSRTILDMVGAEKLLGKGDMLFCPMGTSKPTRVQGAFISDKEVEAIVNFIKAGREYIYDTDVLAKISAPKGIGDTSDEQDEFFDDAIEFIIQKEKASASMLQRQFRIGYNRASRLIDEFEARGIIGSEDGSKPRKVLMTAVQFQEYIESKQ